MLKTIVEYAPFVIDQIKLSTAYDSEIYVKKLRGEVFNSGGMEGTPLHGGLVSPLTIPIFWVVFPSFSNKA